MSALLRRFLVLVALLFWQGGFTFYAAVVVPVGQAELGSHLEQGFITRRVTNYLNLSGAVALIVLAWEVTASQDRSRSRRWARWITWSGMAGTLVALIWLHQRLDELVNLDMHELTDPRAFRTRHRWYLWLSTVQWAFGLCFTILALQAWRSEDRTAVRSEPAVRVTS